LMPGACVGEPYAVFRDVESRAAASNFSGPVLLERFEALLRSR
jgi:hypothetical protein